jgi:hypothetical protein
MNPLAQAAVLAVGLFVALVVAQFVGLGLGRRRLARLGKDETSGFGAVDGAVFALLGLLIAFTFTGASSRFDHRRHLIVEQVNALSTAWMRIDLLPAADQEPIRDLLRRYIAGVAAGGAASREPERLAALIAELRGLEAEIWRRAVESADRDGRPQVASLLLPALNQSFDLSNSRLSATRIKVAPGVMALLIGLALLAGLLAGHAQAVHKRADALHVLVFAALLALTLYFIIDFEHPRLGQITIDASDLFLAELLNSLGPP